MTKADKRRERLFKIPIPTDFTEDDVFALAQQYDCQVITGGRHQHRIVYNPPPESPIQHKVIPVPSHGKYVPSVVIQQIKQLILEIENYKGDPKK